MIKELNIRFVLNALMRRWWLIALLGAITSAVAFVASPRSTPDYQATSTIIFEQPSRVDLSLSQGGEASRQRSLSTQLELINSPSVLRRAASKIYAGAGDVDASELINEARALESTVRPRQFTESDLVIISVKAPEEDLAIRRANAVAEAYVEHTTEEETRAITRSLDEITRQIEALQKASVEAFARDPQQLATIRESLANANLLLDTNLRDLSELTEAQQYPTRVIASITNIEDRLREVTDAIAIADEELENVRSINQPAPAGNPVTQIEASLQAAADDLDRGVQELVQLDLEHKPEPVISKPISLKDVETSVTDASDAFNSGKTHLEQARGRTANQLALPQFTVITDRFTNSAASLLELADQTRELQEAATPSSEELRVIANQIRGARVSIGVSIGQIRTLINQETNPLAYGLLLTVEEEAQRGVLDLDAAINELERVDEPPTPESSVVQRADIKASVNTIFTDLSTLIEDLDALTTLSGSALLIEEKETILHKIRKLIGAIDLSRRQVQTIRNSETNPIAFGSLSTVETQLQDAMSGLNVALDAINQIDGPLPLAPVDIQLKALDLQLDGVDSAVLVTIETLHSARENFEVSGELDAPAIAEVSNRVVAADAILQSAIAQVQELRVNENNVEAYASLLALESKAKGMSSTFAELSADLEQLQNGQDISVNQWLVAAADQTSKAMEMLDRRGEELIDALGRIGSDTLTAVNQLVALRDAIRSTSGTLETASLNLQRAQGEGMEAQDLNLIVELDQRTKTSISVLDDVANQIDQISRPPSSATSLYSQLIQFQQQLQLNRLLSNTASVRVADPAVAAFQVSSSTKVIQNMVLATAAGLLLGALAALATEYLDPRLRTQNDVKLQLDLPVLGAVPTIRGRWNPHPQLTLQSSPPALLESFRMLRTRIAVAGSDQPAKVILVTSPLQKEGKTTVALNLARSIAMEKRKVLLIDGNLRKPELGGAFKIDGSGGLGPAIRDGLGPEEFIIEEDGVRLLPAGEFLPNGADMLISPALRQLLERAKQEHDVVIIDSPPLIGFAETLVLAKLVDAVLLVLNAKKSTYNSARQGIDILESSDVPIIGVVLNRASHSDTGSARYKGYEPKQKPSKDTVESEQFASHS